MICIPLIQNGAKEVSDQYAYSQFNDLVNSIDSGIRSTINSTGNKVYEQDIYFPGGVTINSSTTCKTVDYCFNSDSRTTIIQKDYPIYIVTNFNYPAGWYRVKMVLENATLMAVDFMSI
jgi:hypothetical protein